MGCRGGGGGWRRAAAGSHKEVKDLSCEDAESQLATRAAVYGIKKPGYEGGGAGGVGG